MDDQQGRVAAFKRTTWAEHRSLPPDLLAVKDRLSAIADAAHAASTRKRTLSSGRVPGVEQGS